MLRVAERVDAGRSCQYNAPLQRIGYAREILGLRWCSRQQVGAHCAVGGPGYHRRRLILRRQGQAFTLHIHQAHQYVRMLTTPHLSVLVHTEDQAAIQAPEPSSVPEQQPVEAPVVNETPESVFYESSGSPVELAISLMLGLTLIYAPLTLASIGRHLWIK